MRKTWENIKKDRKLQLVLLFTLLLFPFVVVRLLIAAPAPEFTPEEQLIAVADGERYAEFEGTENFLPVTILGASEFISLISEPETSIALAAVNPEANVTAIYSTTPEETIIASRLVESQMVRAVSIYTQKQIPLSVTDPGRGAPSTFPTAIPANQGGFAGTIFTIFFLLVVAFIIFMFLSQMRIRGGADGAGKKAEGDEIPPDRFADVAGCEEAVEDLQELVLFLKEPERFTRAGAKPPQGALLIGPPGTGKTLLARAVAGEASVPFYAASGSDFMEMYVGVGSSRVRSLFKKARKHPEGAIIFIDEIDAIGRRRSGSNQAVGNQEQESTLNQLLVEMDGFKKSNVIVIGATNRDDVLDPALKRPGRLDRIISVNLPDRQGREKILKTHCQGKPIEPEVDLSMLARRSSGMSGADLAQVVNEACLHAARDDRENVLPIDFDSALATVAMGKARTSAVVSENDRTITAWHEAGHTVAAMMVPEADPPVSVSIIPRGPAGGVTWMAPGDDLFLTRSRAFARLIVAMSGRAAEEILLNGEFTSGPHGDLQAATDLALAMVTQYGMTDMGLMTKTEGILSVGGKAMDESVDAVEHLLAEALKVARAVLAENRDTLELIVQALLDNDTLALADIELIREGAAHRGKVEPQISHSGFQPAQELTRPNTQAATELNGGSGTPTAVPETLGVVALRTIRRIFQKRARGNI